MASVHIGDVLEQRYRVDQPIARGGMSTVYRCVDMRLGRTVAAKVMHEHLAGDPVFLHRFQREARAMAQLSHPNLVSVYDFSTDGDTAFLIMELITGGTLRELLAERGPMPPHAAAAVLRAVLTGLSAVHGRGLIHRDIKPDNILIDADHRVKVGDFGLVRAASAQAATSDQIVGTVSYLSPEQVSGGDLTPASDVYSVGVVAFELLTGTVPFRGDTPLQHALARLEQDVPSPSARMEGIPSLFDALVATATARDPQERFADAAEFLAALDDVAASLELPAYTVPVPRNSAAARTAARPTDFHGVPVGENFTETFAATSVLDSQTGADAANASDATDVIGTNAAANTGDKFGDEQATTRLSFDTRHLPTEEPAGHFETRFDMPTASVPPVPPVAPVTAPETPAGVASASPWPTPAVPAAQPEPPEEYGNIYAPEPAPRTFSNRSPLSLALWLVLVAAATVAIAIGGWWFGSGNYEAIPVLWKPMG